MQVVTTDSSLSDREARASEIRRWIDALNAVHEDAQVFPGVDLHLGGAKSLLSQEANTLWPERSWESSDPLGPPQPGRVDVKAETVTAFARVGRGLAIHVHVEARGDSSFDFALPIRAAPALIRALAEQLKFWSETDA